MSVTFWAKGRQFGCDTPEEAAKMLALLEEKPLDERVRQGLRQVPLPEELVDKETQKCATPNPA